MTTSKTRALTLCALLATTCLAAPALAQEFTPAERQAPDENGVDLISGKLRTPQASVGIGPEGGGLSFVSGWAGGAYYDSFKLELTLTANLACVTMADRKTCFTEANGVFTSREGDGATLTATSAGWLYVGRDGSEVRFFTAHGDVGTTPAVAARGASVTLPDGEVVSYHYRNENGLVRVQSVTSSRGYQLKATYVSDDPAHSGFRKLAKVTAINNAVDYCAPTANACTGLTQDWPELAVTETAGSRTYTDRTGAKKAYGLATGEVVTAREPGDVVLFTVAYDTAKRVKTFSRAGGSWQYRYLDGTDGQKVTRVTNPLGGQRDYLWDPATKRILSITDELEHVTRFDYDESGRLVRTTAPEGNKVELTHDARGNVTERRAKPKAGSGQVDIVTTAAFPLACTNPKSCNKPTSTTDARGFTTNFVFSGVHGALLTATAPAPAAGAVRPQVRYSYTALRAQVKNSSGGLVLETPVYRPTAMSTCQTLAGQTSSAPAACADPNLPANADEVKTSIAYDTTGATNNLLPTSVSTGAGDGSLTATSSSEYDAFGRLAMTDGPLPGTTDAVRYRYDEAGRLVGTIYPDPDGAAGPLKRRAQKIVYAFNDLTRIVHSGTVEGLSDADWANFVSLEQSTTGTDAYGRLAGHSVSGGGITAGRVGYQYDVMGRIECVAVRMGDAPVFGCELDASGADGPDRVTRYAYTARGEVVRVTTGSGTTEARRVASYAYSANGLLRTQLDGENNRTSFGHDGHDRLVSTRFAREEKSRGQTAAYDVEELGYDAGSNVVARKLRDNDDTDPANDPVIGYGYDNLGRLILKDLPGTEPDTSYGYDNLGRMLSASQQPGHALTFTYDALGRNLTQAGPLGTTVYGHDISGRRTRLRWADGFFVTYDHLVTGEMSSIRI